MTKEERDLLKRLKEAQRRGWDPGGWNPLNVLQFLNPVSTAGWAIAHIPESHVQQLGRIASVIGTAPYLPFVAPKETAVGGMQAITGLVTLPYTIPKGIHDYGPLGFAELVAQAFANDYKTRYGPHWKEAARKNPMGNIFDLLTILGPVAKATALGAAAARLSKAAKLGKIDEEAAGMLRSIWREQARPGLLSEGQAFPRVLEHNLPTGGSVQAFLTPSRSPFRRGIQSVNDALSASVPNFPGVGMASRVARANARQLARSKERAHGVIRHVDALNHLPKAGLDRLYWGLQLGDHTEGGLRRFRNALAEEFASDTRSADELVNPRFADLMWKAKQQGFGKELLKSIDEAIKYQPDERYDRAAQAMRDMTELDENVIADMLGFTSLRQDLKRSMDKLDMLDEGSDAWNRELLNARNLTEQIDGMNGELRKIFRDRRGLVKRWMAKRDYEKIPERRERLQELTDLVGKEQADVLIDFADIMARKSRNPAIWWRDEIGGRTPEGAEEFVGRGGDALFQMLTRGYGDQPLIEGRVEELLGSSAFYSPLQKFVSEMPEDMLPAKTLEKRIRNAISAEEYENAGLDNFFREHDGPDLVYKDEFQNFTANALNAYNLHEVHRINAPEAEAEGFGTVYDREWEGNYVSRDSGPGDYHEVTFELPGPRPGGMDYFGKAADHWRERRNVAVHFRFHVFREDGKTKLLVDEIQSDWAGAYRAVKKIQSERSKKIPPDLRNEIQRMDADYEALRQRRRTLIARAEEIRRQPAREMSHEDSLEHDHLLDRADRMSDELANMQDIRRDLYEEAGWEFPAPTLTRVAPSPLGTGMSAKSSYINSPVRWLHRYAAENNVDEIIVVDRATQLVRNGKLDPTEWDALKAQIGTAEGVTEYLDKSIELGRHGRSYLMYAEDIPAAFAREMGEQGVRKLDAYEGVYRDGGDFIDDISGRMPGMVFQMTDEAKRLAMKPRSLYQASPDWNGLPKGATELLEGGRTRIHLFEGANASTWIHELGHVGIRDLDMADQTLLNTYYGAGRALDDWTRMAHEAFARDWEAYVRHGVAPTRELQALFTRLAQWMKAVLAKADEGGKVPEEIRRVFDNMFGDDEDPGIYIPHRSRAPNLHGARTTQGIPRAGKVLGDRTLPREPLFKKAKLALMRSGMINTDPRHLIEHTDKVLALAQANQLREMVLELARPVLPGEFPDLQGKWGPAEYAVKKTGRGVDKPTLDALDAADNADEISTEISKYIDENITSDSAKAEAWAGEHQLYKVDKHFVDLLFKHATGKTPGATTKMSGTAGIMLDAMLDGLRGLLLYANPGFYASNMLGNAWMMATADPRSFKHIAWSFKNAMKGAVGEEDADHLWEQIAIEMGRGPTSGAMSPRRTFVGQGPGKHFRKVATGGEWTSYKLGQWGRRAGRVVDDTFRVAAWKQAAQAYGYKTDAQIRKLLDAAGEQRRGMMDLDTKERRDLYAIRDEAENLMLDFDSMTPFERTWLMRTIFLYPFLRASAKYPFMFAGERPLTAGVLGQAGLMGTQLETSVFGPRPNFPVWAEGFARVPGGWINAGSIAPQAASLGFLQSIAGLGQPAEIGVTRPWGYVNPLAQLTLELMMSQNKYGRDAPAWDILRQDFPAPGYVGPLLGRKSSSLYTDRGRLAALLRSLRVVPYGVDEGYGE